MRIAAVVTLVAALGAGIAVAQENHEGHEGQMAPMGQGTMHESHGGTMMSAASRSYMESMDTMGREMSRMTMSGSRASISRS